MSSTKERRPLNVITVYSQTEVIHTNGVRRVVPIFVRPVDRKTFGKTMTVFTKVTKSRFEVKQKAALFPYIPVRSAQRNGSRCLLDVIDINFSLRPVKEFFRPIRRGMTIKEWYRREDCIKYVLTAGVGRDVSPRSSVSHIDRFNVWLKDHNYFKSHIKTDSDGSVGHSAIGSEF